MAPSITVLTLRARLAVLDETGCPYPLLVGQLLIQDAAGALGLPWNIQYGQLGHVSSWGH